MTPPGGEPSDGVVAVGTPRGMVEAWNVGGQVSLKLVSRDDHCCAKVGVIKPSPADFKACAARTPDGDPVYLESHNWCLLPFGSHP